jgi:hypothetical protein
MDEDSFGGITKFDVKNKCGDGGRSLELAIMQLSCHPGEPPFFFSRLRRWLVD